MSATPGLFLVTLFFGALWCVGWGLAGAALARSKNREPWLGAVLCIFLGVIGLVVLLVLPEVPSDPLAAQGAGSGGTNRSALGIVDERYARGEITRAEFEQLKSDLA